MRLAITCIFILSVLAVNFPIDVIGQIYSNPDNLPDAVVKTQYSANDSIFIFSNTPSGSLMAKKPGGGSATFQWSRSNLSSPQQWEIISGLNIGDTISKVNVDRNGGYKVHISAPGFSKTYIAWAYLDSVSVELKKIDIWDYSCDYLDLFIRKKYLYYFPHYDSANNYKEYKIQNKASYRWYTASKNLRTDTAAKYRVTQDDLPSEKTTFFVEITDMYKKTDTDSVTCPPIASKAVIDTAQREFVVNNDVHKDKFSAPFKITLQSSKHSKNISDVIWFFGDGDTLYHVKDTTHIYYEPKEYTVKLQTISEEGCIDTVSVKIPIDKAEIGTASWPDVPNVFTPNEDGENDYFYIYNVSIRDFKLSIFSRWGKKIYEAAGSGTYMLNEWKGWDGKISGSYASPGVYYYVLEVTTFERDNEKLKNKNGIYKGFFYLFR